jgi:hypothetical protein
LNSSLAHRAAASPLRLLGPVVVLSTLAVLGTGLALILIGQQASRQTFATVLGQRVDPITLHQASSALIRIADLIRS